MTHTVEHQLREILAQDLFLDIPPRSLAADDNLASACGLDSIGFLELRIRCEDRFQIEISDDDFSPENFSSLSSLTRLIEGLRQPGGEPDSQSDGQTDHGGT